MTKEEVADKGAVAVIIALGAVNVMLISIHVNAAAADGKWQTARMRHAVHRTPATGLAYGRRHPIGLT